jgi:hypothetical protein
VAVHWPGTSQDRIGADRAAIILRLQHYYRFHTRDRGWRDIGYNIAIDQAGRVWMLRSTQWRGNLVGAHCASDANKDANEEYVGVLFLLGDREPPSAAMIYAFVDWYRRIFLPGWPNRTDVRMHGQVDGASTACAGPYVKAALPQLRAQSAPQPPQEEEMELTDRIPLLSKDGVQFSSTHTTVSGAFTSLLYYLLMTRNIAAANQKAIAGLAAAVEVLSSDPDLDEDRITAIVRAAVLEAVPDVTADAIVEELAERLAE